MKLNADIDLDFGNREDILKHIPHVSAAMYRKGQLIKHASGVYVTEIPKNIVSGMAAMDYQRAEQLGYFKIDFLNVSVYQKIRTPENLQRLLSIEPTWENLLNKQFVNRIIHINGHHSDILQLKDPIQNLEHMSMFLALIRPGKRHLLGQTWESIAKTIWLKPVNDDYYFKRAHALSYATLVGVHMNLVTERLNLSNKGD